MSNFTLLSTEEYINTLEDFTEEQIEAVRKVRDTYENMTWEQWLFLFEHGGVERKAKLKFKRTLWVNEDGEIYYLNKYRKQYQLMGVIKSEE